MCFYCGALTTHVTCPFGKIHPVIHHNEGGCPKYYDVVGCFADAEDDGGPYCMMCPVPVVPMPEWTEDNSPF